MCVYVSDIILKFGRNLVYMAAHIQIIVSWARTQNYICSNSIVYMMTSEGYINISLPCSLGDEIGKVVGTFGYMTTSEFVKDACRRRLEEMENCK